MSINVNVSGNPVNIKRGKMVTADLDYSKKEFQHRRRMRLEQVRQQSKDIAETVRNKVKKETCKQLSNLEKKGEKDLKIWQNRKLLELQKQYRDCLKDIGLGHAQAVLEEESDCAVESRKESLRHIAKQRGEQAIEKLNQHRNEEHSNKLSCLQKRTRNQVVENTRAKMVANLQNKKKHKSPFKKKKRKVSTDINISSRLSSGSETENEVPQLLNLSSSYSEASTNSSTPRKLITKSPRKNCSRSRISEESTQYTMTTEPSTHHKLDDHCNPQTEEKVNQQYVSPPTRLNYDDDFRSGVRYPHDTRISDRIRNRTIVSDNYEPCLDICDRAPVYRSAHRVYSDHNCSLKENAQTSNSKVNAQSSNSKTNAQFLNSKVNLQSLDSKINAQSANSKVKTFSEQNGSGIHPDKYCGASKPCSKDEKEQEQIPSKPTVTLRTVPNSTNHVKSTLNSAKCGSNLNKVQYYDHKTRFTKQYVADNSSVQKITDDNIEICHSTASETEFIEQMHKRDHDAQVRGQKALEKVKAHRDYQELMKQLPMLQKQERIAAIPSKKPMFHMSEDRLKEYERKRQNQMENAYEKLFPKPGIITIPSNTSATKCPVTSSLPFQTIDVNDSSRTLNVGSWDFDVMPKSIPDRASKHGESELIREATEKALSEKTNLEPAPSQRKENLQDMLQSLTFHRDKLAKELFLLPENSTLHKLAGEMGQIDRLIQMGVNAEKESISAGRRKRSRNRRNQQSKAEAAKNKVISPVPTKIDEESSLFDIEQERSRETGKKISKYHLRCTSTSSGSPSPPSKIPSTVKSKAHRNISRPTTIILQNTSTQTTPIVERPTEESAKTQSKQQEPAKSTTKLSNKKICECYDGNGRKEKADLCEIVIKINEDGKPQICVSPTKIKEKQVIVRTEQILPLPEVEDKQLEKETPKVTKLESVQTQKVPEKQKEEKPKSKRPPKSNRLKTSSWREYLSQNSTSSTSYLSPPDFTSTQFHPHHPYRCTDQQPPKSSVASEKPKQKLAGHLLNILRDKPQQINIQTDSEISIQSSSLSKTKQFDKRLLSYVRRLLNMSRSSIDDLTVSSVSDISTPSCSIVNIQSNNPVQELQDLMKHFDVNMSDIEAALNYSSDGSNIHYNTAEDLAASSTGNDSSKNANASDSKDIREMSLDDYSAENYPTILAVYNKLAENCAKKIENLAAMIEKVRLEKVSMLHSPGSVSDKENSTKYMELPPELKQSKTPSPDSIAEQEELDRQMLEIDYNFAEQLKKMTPAEIRQQFPLSSSSSNNSEPESSQHKDSIDKELMVRFKNLVGSDKSDACPQTNDNKTSSADLPFVPLLIDIPRLPILEVPSAFLQRSNERSKPPTSKGLTAARRFNNNINIIPHELSTIAESESLISAKLQRSDSRVSSRRESPQKDKLEQNWGRQIVTEPIDLRVDGCNSNLQVSSSDSLPDILTELMKNAQADNSEIKQVQSAPELPSDSSTSDLENMETMLKSLGMGWAVATLKKTQEALALTSSSSSVDISVNQKEIKFTDTSRSTSEVSLREIISKQFLTKLSSSNGKSEASGSSASFLKELQDLSSIQYLDISQEKTTRRTSTPVQSSKTTDKSKNDSNPRMTMTGESELSSVKADSDDNIAYLECVPFYSLNESSRSRNSTKDD